MSDSGRKIPILRLAWRNTHRNLRRTILTASAIAVAVLTLTFAMAYINGMIDNGLETYARIESGHVRIRQAGYLERERFMPVHLNVPDLAELVPAIREQPGVSDVVPRIRAGILVDGGASNRPGLLLGLSLADEEPYMRPSRILAEGRLPRPGSQEALLGKAFADQLGVAIGDELTLLGQTAYRSLGGLGVTVTGLARTGIGFLDQRLVVLPLDQAQLLTDLEDGATEVLVFAERVEDADSLAVRLASAVGSITGRPLEVLSWRDQGPLLRLLDSAKAVWAVALFILLFMAAMVIVNTMSMTVMERIQEFGMLGALGLRGRDILRLILSEGLLIGLMGALAGSLLGSGIALWVEQIGIDATGAMNSIDLPLEGVLYPRWRLAYPIVCALLGLVTAGLASLTPALRATRKPPAEALRA